MVNHLSLGATVLVYDGNPLVPNRLVLFDFVETYKSVAFLLLDDVLSLTASAILE